MAIVLCTGGRPARAGHISQNFALITENLFGACEGTINAAQEPFQLRRDIEIALLGFLQAFSSRARLFCSHHEENNCLNLLIDIDRFQDERG